jgi:putative hydrolase of the HAD superfamily
MKLTTVFLDAGGVLLDESLHEEAIGRAAAEILGSLIDGYTLDAYRRDIDEASRAYAPRIYQFVFWKYLKEDPGSFDSVYRSFVARWKEYRPSLALMPGMEEQIRSLHGDFDLGILGQYGGEILDLLGRHSLLDFFAYRYTQDDFDLTKPDPRYYEAVARKCGVRPEECIMVGDRIDKDVVPAKQVGMKTIRVRTGILKKQEPRVPFEVADAELEDIASLADAARSIAGLR